MILSTLICAFAAPAQAGEAPDAREILRAARLTQSAQEWQLRGKILVGRVSQPLRLILNEGTIRYEFLENGDSITLRLGEKTSTLQETRDGKTGKIAPARFDDVVRGTDIRYEDLAFRFLYWSDAKVLGDELYRARSSWKIEVRPPKGESQYSRVLLWIAKDGGDLMKAESFDAKDQWARRFTVIGAMKRDGHWLLQKLRIESADGRKSDPQPTYLIIDDVEKKSKG